MAPFILVLLAAHTPANPTEEPVGPLPVTPVIEQPDFGDDPFAAAAESGGFGMGGLRRVHPGRATTTGDTVLVRFESFEVPTLKMITLLDEWEVRSGADALRAAILAMAQGNEAEVIDAAAATVEAGARHVLEAVHEYTSPSEFEPPEVITPPQAEDQQPEPPAAPTQAGTLGPACPTSFETRNTGTTFEFEIRAVTAEEHTWDLSLAPESVELAGLENWGQDGLYVPMPNFNTTRASTAIRVRDGIWTLVAAQSPLDEQGKLRRSVKRVIFLKVQTAR